MRQGSQAFNLKRLGGHGDEPIFIDKILINNSKIRTISCGNFVAPGKRLALREFSACIFIFKTEKDSASRILYLRRG
jgi:hypothetical protein